MNLILILLSFFLFSCSSGSKPPIQSPQTSQFVGNASYAVDTSNQLYMSTENGVWGLMPNQLTNSKNIINSLNCGFSYCSFVTQNGDIFVSRNLEAWNAINQQNNSQDGKLTLTPALYSVIAATLRTQTTKELGKENSVTQSSPSIAVGDNGTIIVFDSDKQITTLHVTNNKLRSLTQFILKESLIFIAVGDNGTILTSGNGYDWQILSNTNTAANLNQVIAVNNVGVIAVGDGGTIISSTNGIDWVNRNSNTIEDLLTINYLNNTYVVGGAKGTILLSSNITSWYTPVVTPTQIVNYNISEISRTSAGWFLAYAKSTLPDSPELLLQSQFGTVWTVATPGAQAINRLTLTLFFRSIGNFYNPCTAQISDGFLTSSAISDASSCYITTIEF